MNYEDSTKRVVKTSEELGGVLKRLRKYRNLTQQHIAEIIGIDRSTYAYYESGGLTPSIFTLIKLSEIFGVELTTLFFVDVVE